MPANTMTYEQFETLAAKYPLVNVNTGAVVTGHVEWGADWADDDGEPNRDEIQIFEGVFIDGLEEPDPGDIFYGPIVVRGDYVMLSGAGEDGEEYGTDDPHRFAFVTWSEGNGFTPVSLKDAL
jgi:hypothetical protein